MADSRPSPPLGGDLLHGLPPILPEGRPRALILGSFPSVRSLEAYEYYAHPQNWFWRVMQYCGVVADASAPYAVRVERAQSHGLAIWDLYASVRREGSGDDNIRDATPNPIDTLLASHDPFPILLNGRRSREFRRAFPDPRAKLIALPSTSPRPLHWNTEESQQAAIAEWRHALQSAIDGARLSR